MRPLADHRRLAGEIGAASENCDTALMSALEMDEVEYLKRAHDALTCCVVAGARYPRRDGEDLWRVLPRDGCAVREVITD
ncbi:hypothetical protein AS181_18925 [Gordonia sp. SGD-V-85]|nr:hypothetical protein AS181_18925 [Gordonia sp. SGD-V-85]